MIGLICEKIAPTVDPSARNFGALGNNSSRVARMEYSFTSPFIPFPYLTNISAWDQAKSHMFANWLNIAGAGLCVYLMVRKGCVHKSGRVCYIWPSVLLSEIFFWCFFFMFKHLELFVQDTSIPYPIHHPNDGQKTAGRIYLFLRGFLFYVHRYLG